MAAVDLIAGVAYLILDICALFSVIGSTILFIGGIVAASRGRRFRAPEQVYMWSGGGLFLGISGLVALTLSDQFTMGKTFILGYSTTTIGIMLFFSVSMLVLGKILQVRIRRSI